MPAPPAPELYEGARPGPAAGSVICPGYAGPGGRLAPAEATVVIAVVGAVPALTLAHVPWMRHRLGLLPGDRSTRRPAPWARRRRGPVGQHMAGQSRRAGLCALFMTA